MRYGDVDALETRDVPPAALDLAINPWIRKEGRDVGVAAAVARILVVEDRARVRGGADEGEGEDDVLEHLCSRCEGTNKLRLTWPTRRRSVEREDPVLLKAFNNAPTLADAS